ncbi:hypothetical protein Anas_04903 [Armadillidium nasatum]|uniref:Uncharacterized protein n=1 Tax=Armadillidium nasatum TaxID=96803 RepID=A0A5N5SSA1_9CRUS|nr:hypothetical protein Anas_04903 [Armadillidium nasatum]
MKKLNFSYKIFLIFQFLFCVFITTCQAHDFNNENSSEIEDIEELGERQVKKSYLELFESIFDLVKTLYKSTAPYLPFGFPGINWDTIDETIDAFRKTLSRADASFRSAGAAGLITAGIGSIVGPYILDFIKMVVSSFIGFIDNLYFVATGQALTNHEIPEDLWNDLFQVTIERLGVE